jgi:hypothetical protein
VTEPQQPPAPVDKVGSWLGHIKGLTMKNIGVIVILILIAIPTYFTYRITNDEKFASIFFSTYSEHPIPATDCFMRVASVSGHGEDYRVGRPFAYSGRDRWVLSIETPNKPSDDDAVSLCKVLGAIVEYARDPLNKPTPVFPNTDTKIFPENIPIQPGAKESPP